MIFPQMTTERTFLLKVTLELALHKPEVTMETKVRSTRLQSTAVEHKNSEVLMEHLTAPDTFLLHLGQGIWKVQRQVLHPIPANLSPNSYRSQSCGCFFNSQQAWETPLG